jgi:hypothetical protein
LLVDPVDAIVDEWMQRLALIAPSPAPPPSASTKWDWQRGKDKTMHKDLTTQCGQPWKRGQAEAEGIHSRGQSLALAREAWINAFDKSAEVLDNAEGWGVL